MKGAPEHQHIALFGAGVILSAVAVFVVTPSAASVLAAGGARAILAVPPLAPSRPAPRRSLVRITMATPPTRRRPLADTTVQPGTPVARAVGAVRRAVGLALRTAVAYFGLAKKSCDPKLLLTLPLR